MRAEVERLARLGTLLRLIREPSSESDAGVRERLVRLKDWGTTTVYPLVLHLLDRRARGEIDGASVATSLRYLESFLARRLLVGRATTNLNRTLLGAAPEIDQAADPAHALHRYLSSGRKLYASDAEIAVALMSVPFYLNGRAPQRKLVLQRLEESYASKEQVDASHRG